MNITPGKGLRLEVLHGSFRDALSVTERLDNVTLVGTCDQRGDERESYVTPLDGDERGPFTPTTDAPPVALVIRTLFGGTPHLYLSPVIWDSVTGTYNLPADSDGPWMASGAFAKGDSRYTRLVGRYGYPFGVPVPLHDRHESWALYAAMSRD